MESLVEKVQKILTRRFPPPARIDVEDEDGILGSVVSSEFRGMPTIDRVNAIWNTLDRALTPAERRRVLMIVAVTPDEELIHTHNV